MKPRPKIFTTYKTSVVANWKMNPKTLAVAFQLAGAYRVSKNTQLVVCPPEIFLPPLTARFGKKMAFGAQDCFWESSGAYTGETSPSSLADSGAQCVILGHSERRKYLGENDIMVNKKLLAAVKAKLTVILCLGGGLRARDSAVKTKAVLKRQFSKAILGLKTPQNLVLTFEPTYSISTSGAKRSTPEDVADMARFLRKLSGDRFGPSTAKTTPILYGGSVDSGSFKAFLVPGQIDGFLVGGASLRPKEFNSILLGD